MIRVLCIRIVDRLKATGLVQDVLSKHAGIITTRLGFHEITDELCSREAVIVLHLGGSHSECAGLDSDLKQIGGIEVIAAVFDENMPCEAMENTGIISVAVVLTERDADTVRDVQKILTSYGCYIKTRLGVNEMFYGRQAGLIILELKGDMQQRRLLAKDLDMLKNVRVRTLALQAG
ncbi:MAG: hypothetical protein LBV26_06850 [Bacteroidales bacterium]|jgi:hypothetical protein|nr:hypothetical protein [Bacteroidales bacterium]